ncbi:hypothetical protein Tco_1561133 [Tanacetum coccineum]
MIRWLKRMFPLLLLQDLMNRFFLSRHGYFQNNLIFRISVDIIKNTNFFGAFTASTNVPTIYIQQLWNSLTHDAKTRALEITPVDSAHPFESPPAGVQVMDFVNKLGYPKEIHFVSRMYVNNLYQAWREILSLINQCLTCKTSGSDKPRHPVLQMLWGIVTRSNVDYAALLWEEFVQAIQTFFTHWAHLNILTKKPTPYVIPYCRFTKLIIYYFGCRHNIHRRPVSHVHVTRDEFLLGNLKFVPKGKNDEVFGKPIPQELITEAIQKLPYYHQYLEMAARKPTAKEGGKKKTASKADNPKKPILDKQSKPVKEKTSKPSPSKKVPKGKVMKVRKGKTSEHLVDEEEEVQHATEPQMKDDEYDLHRGIQMSLESFQAHVSGVAIREPASGITQILSVVEGKGKGIATDEQADAYTGPSAQPEDDTSSNVVRDTSSPADAKTGADMEKSNKERTIELDEGQTRSDPGKTPESRPPPDLELMEEDQAGSKPGQSHVALAGPNPEPMHEDFIATIYPKVHESLKLTAEEHVLIENPPSSFGTLSSMKILEENFTFGDQFLNKKSTKEEPGKVNVEAEVESMVTVPIHQASSSVPPLFTPVIDLLLLKPVSPPVQEPVITATTATTTITLSLPPPPQQQSTIDPELATCVFALEKICVNFEKKHKLQDKTTLALSSRVFRLLNHDLYLKIDKYVNEVVKEVVYNALQAPIHERYKDLSKFEMKEILRDRMEEFIEATTKSRKRHRDDQDPPQPPPKDSDQSKKKRHDTDALASKQPLVQKSSAWKTSDTREAPSGSSKQMPASLSEQPVNDVSIPDHVHLSDSEDTGVSHLPKIKTRPD